MRALVRTDDPALIRLDADETEEALAPVPVAVGAFVVFLQPPERRRRLADQDAVCAPVAPEAGGIVGRVGEDQAGHVVRAARQILLRSSAEMTS